MIAHQFRYIRIQSFCRRLRRRLRRWGDHVGALTIAVGKSPSSVSGHTLILFPYRSATLSCGLAGIVAYKASAAAEPIDIGRLDAMIAQAADSDFSRCTAAGRSIGAAYLGGPGFSRSLLTETRRLKQDDAFVKLFFDRGERRETSQMVARLAALMTAEADVLNRKMGRLDQGDIDVMTRRIENLKDAEWCLRIELLANLERVEQLIGGDPATVEPRAVLVYKKFNAVLNSIDRLEVRGRDSAGISLMFELNSADYLAFMQRVEEKGIQPDFDRRKDQPVMVNGAIRVRETFDGDTLRTAVVTFTYKVAAEIGHLGDNIRFLRQEIRRDKALQSIAALPLKHCTVSAHTRWASVGAITEPNCHPVDNLTRKAVAATNGTIHVCLNGDIDNYLELKAAYEDKGGRFHAEVTTDTKIIPLQIEGYVAAGNAIEDAFRLAVNDFEGSHAISMHTDLAPGKLFLAQRGSGQAVFVGIGADRYMPSSEVYGFVEETDRYIKLDGEKVIDGKDGKTQGQIIVLDQSAGGELSGLRGCYYDGTPVRFDAASIETTAITSRDIDRQAYPHYFLKEISESPVSVEQTLRNQWKVMDSDTETYGIALDQSVVPDTIRDALKQKTIRRICFVGQGTAGVAAQACADILSFYTRDPALQINAVKASEMSGFKLGEGTDDRALSDTLMIAISQSGTTTDTNRTVDMVRERGGYTLAIVNRRDSDITFKVDGVFYTSSGRDIEMSVASTKAFYSQIVAGALLGLYIAAVNGRRDAGFISDEIKRLLRIPDMMRSILALKESIGDSARRLAVTKTYWAVVGSGPNKSSADEIRIKLSELCYKTISTDYVEDKKHIDLSSEPLIIVCAAGTRGTVIGDIIKDTAIFQAHKAVPIVIADEGEERFSPYATDVFHVPKVAEHLAPIVNTLAGHIWGYYAALSINDTSRFLHGAREELKATVEDYARKGLDVYEVILERGFREKIADLYSRLRQLKKEKRLPSFFGIEAAADITLLLKYLAGRLPVSDFELDFDKKGTPANMLATLFERLGESINTMARPIDAIKHQAKTVTVGTSRISDAVEGILFEVLSSYGFSSSQLINRNVLVLKNLQQIVGEIRGAILYRIDGLNALGEVTEKTRIHVLKKEGILAALPSRVETDTELKGTKRIIVRQGNVYIGKGRKDDRSIIVIPVISASSSAPNLIEFLLLLTIGFREPIELSTKIKALGGKYEHIKNIVDENSVAWKDEYLNLIPVDELFGQSAEKNAEFIVSRQNGRTAARSNRQ